MERWGKPAGRALHAGGVRADHLTWLGLGLSVGAGAAFALGHAWGGGMTLALAGLCDILDGAVARASGPPSAFGAFLDSVVDRYSDFAIFLGVAVFYGRAGHARGAALALLALVGAVMVSYTRARAAAIGVACDVGLLERPERLLLLVAGGVSGHLEPALWVLVVLGNLTAWQRIAHTRRAVGAALGAWLALAAMPASAGPARELEARAATELRDWSAAIAALRAGDPRPAAALPLDASASAGPVGDVLLLLRADALERLGDVDGARRAALELADAFPASPLAPRGLLLAAALAERAGDHVLERELHARLVETYPEAPEWPVALYLSGAGADARGDYAAAAGLFAELERLAPGSPWATGARDRLALLAARGHAPSPLAAEERLERAGRLLLAGRAKEAAAEAERVVADAGANAPHRALRALRLAAQAHSALGRHVVAAAALDAAAGKATGARAAALRVEQARALLAGGQRRRALAVLAPVAALSTGVAGEAAYLAGTAHEALGSPGAADASYRHAIEAAGDREAAALAWWRLGWLAHGAAVFADAAEAWDRAARHPQGRGLRPAALYWAARARERGGERALAEALYGELLTEAPGSYYGLLALGRVSAPPPPADPGVRLPDDPRAAAAGDAGLLRLELLARLDLRPLAEAEVERLVRQSGGDGPRLYALSEAARGLGRWSVALSALRGTFARLAEAGHPAVPRAFWQGLYPDGWAGEIARAAGRARIDPALVHAVVREESSYEPHAVSRTGARGLMQLMPATAEPMARARGWAWAAGALLDEPAANVELGAAFLGELLREFPNPQLALAAYNAGPGRVRQWWAARRSDDLDLFVEQLPFDETRAYVKRVWMSWNAYRRIYLSEPRDR